MAKAQKTLTVPFDRNGNQRTWLYEVPEEIDVEDRFGNIVKHNHEFDDILTYESYSKGRSSMHFVFRRKVTDTTVTFWLNEFERLIPYMEKGKIHGRFTFRKQGANYTCLLVQNH